MEALRCGLTWLPGGPEALHHLSHLSHHGSSPWRASISSETCQALCHPGPAGFFPHFTEQFLLKCPLLPGPLLGCTSQASGPRAMCVPQYGAQLTSSVSAALGQRGPDSCPLPGMLHAFASLSPNLALTSPVTLPPSSPSPAGLPFSLHASLFPPHPPPLKSYHLSWPSMTAPVCSPCLTRRLWQTRLPGTSAWLGTVTISLLSSPETHQTGWMSQNKGCIL